MKTEWICGMDKMPEFGQTVLVCLKSGFITCAYRSQPDGVLSWQCFGDVFRVIDKKNDYVTHWMPLPELPNK